MLRTRVDLEHLLHVLARQRRLRQHPPHRLFDDALGMLPKHLLHRRELLVAHVPGVMEVALLLHLPARQLHLFGVDDDDEVPAVDVRRERRLMLSTQDLRDPTGEPAKRLLRRVNQPPPTLDVLRLQCVRLHALLCPEICETRYITGAVTVCQLEGSGTLIVTSGAPFSTR